MRKQYDDRFKAKVALEAVKNELTLAQIASRFHVHANQVGNWRKILVAEAPRLFRRAEASASTTDERQVEDLFQQIGRMKVELDWLKKTAGERR